MFSSKKSLVLVKVAGGYAENNKSMTVTATCQQLRVYGGIGGYKASKVVHVQAQAARDATAHRDSK